MTRYSALDLSALLCSRVCHDVVGSVGAVSNGLEMLDEETDQDMRQITEELVRSSAAKASARLTFSRVAFGAAGSARAEIDLDEARLMSEGLMAFEKADLVWELPRLIRPKNEVKLLLNLLLIALSAVPRGGAIRLTMPNEGSFDINCTGPSARVPNQADAFSDLPPSLDDVDAHAIQPIYAALLAENLGVSVQFEQIGEAIRISFRD